MIADDHDGRRRSLEIDSMRAGEINVCHAGWSDQRVGRLMRAGEINRTGEINRACTRSLWGPVSEMEPLCPPAVGPDVMRDGENNTSFTRALRDPV